jgi:transcription termination factor Rho
MNGPVRAGQAVRQQGSGNQVNRSNRLNLNGPDEVRAPRAVDGALQPIKGFVDVNQDGHAVIRVGFSQSRNDAYLSITMVRKLGIRPGDVVEGVAREPRENDRYWGLKELTSVNGKPLSEARNRRRFEDLVPVYPKEKIVLETGKEPVSTRLIDLVAPIGRGQRGLIVSPPKAGKTTIMKEISTGIAANFPGVHLMAVLIGERPEEVTDIARHISAITDGRGETAASNFDEPALEQTRVAEVALERAKRLVELGQDVVIVMDSITRLARAYNLAIPTSGRTLSGGFDPAALYPPKRFFGAARNFEEGGSLTIIATALVDTGSRMDDLVYEEFKGTGNMELHLDRRIAERRIYPAINVQRSGTRRDDLLFTPEDYQSVVMMHRMMDMLDEEERTAMVVRRLKETNNNKQFLASLKS